MSPSGRWDGPPSRRQLLRAGTATAIGTLTHGLSGCLETLTSAPGPLGSIPAEAEAVARVDVQRALSDPAADRIVDAALKPLGPVAAYAGPTDLATAQQTFENRTGLDPARAEAAIAFGTYPPAGGSALQGAVRIDAAWDESAVVEATAGVQSGGGGEVGSGDDGGMAERTHHGRPLYAPPPDGHSLWLGVLDSDAYVVGTGELVKGTLAVAAGEHDPVSDPLQDAYGAIRSAPFRFASAVPADRLPKERFVVGGAAIDPQRFVPVEHVAGATYSKGYGEAEGGADEDTDEDTDADAEDDAETDAETDVEDAATTVGLVAELRTGRGPDATDVRNALVGWVASMEETTANPAVASALASVEIERDGSRVRVAFEGPVDRASTVVTVFSNQLLGFLFPGVGGP